MRTDPEMRGASAGSNRSAKRSRAKAADADLQTVIERVVVSTCFKGAMRNSDSPDAGGQDQPCRDDRPRQTAGPSARPAEAQAATASAMRPSASALADVKRFIAVLDKVYAKLLTDGDFDFVGFMRARSLGPSDMLDLLEACAVRLGEEWECDSRGFVHVTVAVSRLQRILAMLSQENRCFETVSCDRSMLFIIPRGETHHFAVYLMEERFRLEGWETRLVFADPMLDLPHVLKTGDYRLVCIAWLDSTLKNRVESVLHAIRTSVNRERTCVVAGGPAAEHYTQWLEERGVEKVCSNAQIALETAERHGANRNSAQSATGINGSLLEPLRSA